jgi:CRP/FNR family transcriptional regulator, cyclic AMP receptor protein
MNLSRQFPQLAKADLFEDMASGEISDFIDACELRTLPSGTVVLEQDKPVSGMFLIAHGCIEVSLMNAEGHVAIIHHAREGETLGEIEAISLDPCLARCTTVGPVTILHCPVALLARALGNPLVQRNIMRITRGRLLRDNQRKYMDQNYPLDRRVCAYLLRLADRNNRVPQSQGYIANLASCSRQSINRALALLREEGLISVEKGKIRLLDRIGLERKLAGQESAGQSTG